MHKSNPMYSDRDADGAIARHYVFKPSESGKTAASSVASSKAATKSPRLLAVAPDGPSGPGGFRGGRSQGPLMTMNEVVQMTSLSRGTIYNRLEDEESNFPKPVKVGSRSIRFRRSEIESWIESLPVSDRSIEDREL